MNTPDKRSRPGGTANGTLQTTEDGRPVLRYELRREGDGCLLVFNNTLDDRSKLARVGAGWHLCLDVLEANLDGRQLPWKPDERWNQLYSTIYQQAFD